MNGQIKTLLGFDYGTKRIGVAVGQALTQTATPLETVAVKNTGPDWDSIARLIIAWQPSTLVVGMPYNMDGSENGMTHAARRFGEQLKERHKIPVHMVDERLSSHAAQQLTDKRQDIDKIAAQLILQTWLQHAPREETAL